MEKEKVLRIASQIYQVLEKECVTVSDASSLLTTLASTLKNDALVIMPQPEELERRCYFIKCQN